MCRWKERWGLGGCILSWPEWISYVVIEMTSSVAAGRGHSIAPSGVMVVRIQSQSTSEEHIVVSVVDNAYISSRCNEREGIRKQLPRMDWTAK